MDNIDPIEDVEDLRKNNYKIKEITCPSCESETARLVTHLLDIPYYDDFLMINISCPICGYRISDFYNTQNKRYSKQVYVVDEESDATTKVVRAREGIVHIPELGVTIEPAGDPTTWIRNLEGILNDVESKLQIALRSEDDEDVIEETQQRIAQLIAMQNYDIPYTLIVEDPSGNSIILPAQQKKLTNIDNQL